MTERLRRIQQVLVVYKKSLYQIYVREHRNVSVKQALRRGDAAARRMARSHEVQREALKLVKKTLARRRIEATYLWRGRMRTPGDCDLVLAVGGDGTVLDTAHRILTPTPLLALNSDPETSVGRLCAGTAADLDLLLDELEAGALRPARLARLRVRVGGHEVLGPCLNDVLFAHRSPAEMSRFELAVPIEAGRAWDDRSLRALAWTYTRNSGIWVSTATGSTAAMSSAGGKLMRPGSRRLQYRVREPFAPPDAPLSVRFAGYVNPGEALGIINRMRSARLWGDGVHRRAIVPYGQPVLIDEHPCPLPLVFRSH